MIATLWRAVALAYVLSPGIASAARLWDVTFAALAYNAVTGEVGEETVRYRYDPNDLELTSCCFNFFEGWTYSVRRPVLNYQYHGIDNGAGGNTILQGGGHDWYRSLTFGGRQLGGSFNVPFLKDPYDLSLIRDLTRGCCEEGVPLFGGEGNFIWIRDVGHYFDVFGKLPRRITASSCS